jgi:sugar phosphate permease
MLPDVTADHRPTHVRVYVSLWLAALASIAYVCRTSIAIAEKDIRAALELSEEEMGLVMGPAFFWTYALAQIPTAWLGERYGSRLMIVLFAAASSLATLQFGLANSLLMLLVARMAMGIGQAGMFPCATQTIAKWHPLSERARASGVLGAAMQAGHGVGIALTGVLIGALGWRPTFLVFALPGFAWAAGFAGWFRNSPQEHPRTNEAERMLISGPVLEVGAPTHPRAPTPWLALLTSPSMWLICSQQFFRAGGQVFFASWFATYLQETRGVSLEKSAWLTALPVVAMMIAALLGGGVSDYVYNISGSLDRARRGVAASSLLLCALIVAGAYFVADPVLAVAIISVGIFCAGFAGPCAYAVSIDMGGRHVPAVFSTMNMIGNFGAGLLAWYVPYYRSSVDWLLQRLGITGVSSWDAVLHLFAATYLAAALCWMRLRIRGSVFDATASG